MQIPPKKQESNATPAEVAGVQKKGFQREIISEKSPAPRQPEKQTIRDTKPIAERSMEAPKLPTLPSELLVLIMTMAPSVNTAEQMAAASKFLQQLKEESANVDLQKLEEYAKTHPTTWSFQDECSLRILRFAASLDNMPTLEDLKKASTLNVNLTPEQAASQLATLEENYKAVQTVQNDLLKAAIPLAYSVGSFISATALWYTPLLVMTGLELAKGVALDPTLPMTIMQSLPLAGQIGMGVLSIAPIATGWWLYSSIVEFKETASSMMSSLAQKLGV